jgi:hypothetical protein
MHEADTTQPGYTNRKEREESRKRHDVSHGNIPARIAALSTHRVLPYGESGDVVINARQARVGERFR